MVRKQTLFFICRCQSTQILKTVKSQKSSFDKMFKMVLLHLKCLKCRISFCIKHFTRSVVYNIFVATYLLRPPSKHRQRCLASAERKVVPPRVRGPLPPLPLCNFGSVTFHPNSFTCCTFVWSRRLRSITPLYITVPVDPSPPVYRHYSPKCQRRKKVITKMNTTKRGLHIVGK